MDDSAKNTATKLFFTFNEIRDVLYATGLKYFDTLPLPYVKPQGKYRSYGALPKIIHLTWNHSEIPKQYIKNVISFRDANPSYSVWLWVDHPCPRIKGVEIRQIRYDKLINRGVFFDINGIGIRNDLLRMEITYKYGGIYSDIDAVGVKEFDSNFEKAFLAHEPHKWLDVCSGVLGFPAGDMFLECCLYNFKDHLKYMSAKHGFEPNNATVLRMASGIYLLAHLFSFDDLSEMNFINQDYLVTDTGKNYSYHTMDGAWVGGLRKQKRLYNEGVLTRAVNFLHEVWGKSVFGVSSGRYR